MFVFLLLSAPSKSISYAIFIAPPFRGKTCLGRNPQKSNQFGSPIPVNTLSISAHNVAPYRVLFTSEGDFCLNYAQILLWTAFLAFLLSACTTTRVVYVQPPAVPLPAE